MILKNNNMFIKKHLNEEFKKELEQHKILFVDKNYLLNNLNNELFNNKITKKAIQLKFTKHIKPICVITQDINLLIQNIDNVDIIKLSYNAFLYNYENIKNKMSKYNKIQTVIKNNK